MMKSDFLEKYKPFHEPFTRYCSSRTFGWMETEDLVQESVLAALENYERIADKEKLPGYLIGVANNVVKNKRRRLKFKGEWNEEMMAKLESQTQSAEVALDIQFLQKAIDQLPEKQKEALILFEISGFSIREISEIQESSEGATKTRLSRARQGLRELLNEDGKRIPLAKRLAIYASFL